MTAPPAISTSRRDLVGRSVLALIVAYVLAIGGTYNGVLMDRLQIVSLLLLTAGAAGWWWFARRKLADPSTPLDPALVVWAAAYMVAVLANKSTGRAAIGVWYAGLYAGIWLILSNWRRRGLPGRWITDAALFTSIPLILLALAQVADWFPAWIAARQNGIVVALVPPRVPSSLGNPNALGAIIAMLLPLGWERVRGAARRFDRALWAVWFALALITLALTSSRGAWIGATAAFGALGLLALRDRGWHIRWSIIGVTLVLLGIAVALVFSLDMFNTPRRSMSERQELYRIALDTFLDHPLTGTGPFTFGRAVLENRSIPPDQPHVHAHNLILNTAAELGILGLAALGFTALLIVRRWQQVRRATSDPGARAHSTACGAALIASGTHAMVDMPMMIPAVMLLMLGILAAGMTPGTEMEQPARRSTKLVLRYAPLVLWIVVLATGWWSAAVYTAYIDGERRIYDGDYQAAMKALRHASEAQPFIPLYDAEYAYACGLAAYHGDITCLPDGIAAYQRALEREPAYAVWWANLAALYWQNDQPDDAIKSMRRAAERAPESPDLWLNLGIFYERQGMDDRAAEAYRRALEARPVWGHARFWWKTMVRQTVLRETSVEETPYHRAQHLWDQGDRAAATAVFDREIARDPTLPDSYFDQVRLYIAAGEFSRAREYLDAGGLLVHTPIDQAWYYALEAVLARKAGDWAGWQTNLNRAAQIMLPDQTGVPLYFYGPDVANLHFLRLKVQGTWLPQLTSVGRDPILVEWLEHPYDAPPAD